MGELDAADARQVARTLLRHAELGDRAAVERLAAGLDDDGARRVIIVQAFTASTTSPVNSPLVPYFPGGGVWISERVASLWHRVLSAPKVRLVLDYQNDPEEKAAREGVRNAAKSVEAQVKAARRNRETPDDGLGAWSDHEWISTNEAAQILGLSRRRVQQLAAGGMGRQDASGRWHLSRARVHAYRDGQRHDREPTRQYG